MQIYSGRKPIVVGGQQFHLPCTSSKKNTRELIDGVAVLSSEAAMDTRNQKLLVVIFLHTLYYFFLMFFKSLYLRTST